MRALLHKLRLPTMMVCSLLVVLSGLFFVPSKAHAEASDATKQAVIDYARTQYGAAAVSICSDADCRNVIGSNFASTFDAYIKSSAFTFPTFDINVLAKGSGDTDSQDADILAAMRAIQSNVEETIQKMIEEGEQPASTTNCAVDGLFAWILCPFSVALVNVIKDFMVPVLENLLYVSPETTFTNTFKQAWNSFRNIGLALVLIAGLFMVISQALGLEILDAYTIRKLMPRLGVALVGIALSWSLLKLAITLTNDLGIGMHDLIVAPFGKMGYTDGTGGLDIISHFFEFVLGVGVGVTAFISATMLGFAGILSLLGTTVLALFIGLLVLAIRQAVIVIAILMAPLAIAAYVLPGTQKLWKFWKDALMTSLMMFPIIMAFTAAGEALSRVMIQQPTEGSTASQFINIQAYLVLIAPYLMLPFAFKLAGGLMSSIFSALNDRGKGLFDRGRKFRSDTRGYRRGEFASGSMSTGRMRTAYAARTTLARQGGLDPRRAARTRYKLSREKLVEHTARERAEKDHGFSLGDTEETRAAIFANDRNSFGTYLNNHRAEQLEATLRREGRDEDYIRRHRNDNAYSAEVIDDKIARLEAGTGAMMGSDVMKAAAMRGQTVLDGAGWFNEAENRFDLEGFGKAAKHLADRGIFRAEDMGAMLGENQQRPDMAASSFSQRVDIADWAIKSADGSYTQEQRDAIYGRTYQSMRNSSAELANLRTARAVAKQGGERLEGTLLGHTYAGIDAKDGVQAGASEMMDVRDRLASEYATFANFQDMASSASPVAREQFAVRLQQTYTGEQMHADVRHVLAPLLAANNNKVSNQQIMEYLRGGAAGYRIDPATGKPLIVTDGAGNNTYVQQMADPELIQRFTARRREYGSAREMAGAVQGGRDKPPDAGSRPGPQP